MQLSELLNLAKKNLIIEHSADDELLLQLIKSAVTYAEGYQHLKADYYEANPMSPTTVQGVLIIVAHLYESRDGSSGGMLNSSTGAAEQSWSAAEKLLKLDREWSV